MLFWCEIYRGAGGFAHHYHPLFSCDQEPAWKEQIARTLLVSIRMAASAIRDTSSTLALSSPVDFSQVTPSGQTMEDIMSDAVAAVAIIAGGSGVLYPGVTVQSA